MNRSDALDLLAGLLHRIAPEVDLASVATDAPLQEQIDLDSMDFLSLVLHAQTGIDVPERTIRRSRPSTASSTTS